MDMEFTEEQQALQTTARSFLSTESPLSAAREMEASEDGFSRELWKKMADLGWLGLPHSEDVGGAGMGSVELVVLAKELGRTLCPSPYIQTVILAGGAIAAAGSDQQKQRLLPAIISGETVIAFALQEENALYDARGVSAKAAKDGDGYVLNGTKMFVEFASAADRVLVVARTAGEAPANEGLTLFLVDPNDVNVQLEPLNTMARDRQFQMKLDGVKVRPEDVIGTPGKAWDALEGVIERGVVALCGYMVGASESIHATTTAFAKERIQFGRPIGSFQAIQHYLALSITEILAADTTVFYAAWTLDEGEPSREIVAKAKAFAGDTFRKASDLGAQIHGGIGYDESMDTTLFLRRGKQYQLSMGGTGYWEDIIAEEILDR
ncbi:MAG: acyl-CoA/acyl-ACP dehydrogenase [Chloroflexi bacterium]|nr:acyl-CoA/acyl-ACP dehydrogenase [Chloroflexota bacterium]